MLTCDCPPCPFSSLSPVLADLRQGDLTASESKRLSDIMDVVRLQSGKSPEVMSITADVLQIHGFENESRLLAGRQFRPSYICQCYVTLHFIHKASVLERTSIKHFYSPCFCTFMECKLHMSCKHVGQQALSVEHMTLYNCKSSELLDHQRNSRGCLVCLIMQHL